MPSVSFKKGELELVRSLAYGLLTEIRDQIGEDEERLERLGAVGSDDPAYSEMRELEQSREYGRDREASIERLAAKIDRAWARSRRV